METELYNKHNHTINWEKVWEIQEFQLLKQTFVTSNGIDTTVANHLYDTVNAMKQLLDNENASDELYEIMMLSALFHDLGKCETTFYHSQRKCWTSRGHASYGETLTRKILKGIDLKTKECVCYFVRNHEVLNYVVDNPIGVRKIIILSCDTIYPDICNIKNLLKFLKCDESNLDSEEIDFILDLSNEMNCLDKPYQFETPNDKYEYFNQSVEIYPQHSSQGESEFVATFIYGTVQDLNSEGNVFISEEKYTDPDEFIEAIMNACTNKNDFMMHIDGLDDERIEALLSFVYSSKGTIKFIYGDFSDEDKFLSPIYNMNYETC